LLKKYEENKRRRELARSLNKNQIIPAQAEAYGQDEESAERLEEEESKQQVEESDGQ